MIVGKVDDPGVKALESLHQNGHIGQRLAVIVAVGLPGEAVRGVLTGDVVALAGQDHRAIPLSHDK